MQRAAEAFPVLLQRRAQLAGTVSGGEQQMLALTRAYLRQPRLVLLDEVSMGLAPRIVEEIFAFLRRLGANGTALVLVEQYVTRALAMADFVFLLNRGPTPLCWRAVGTLRRGGLCPLPGYDRLGATGGQRGSRGGGHVAGRNELGVISRHAEYWGRCRLHARRRR